MATPNSIYESAYKGDYDLVRQKVDEDLELVKKTDDNGRTLLHWASISGSLKLVTFLIQSDSEVNAEDDTGITPLVLSASSGRIEVVKLLITNKANVNHKTAQGHSALQYASSKGFKEICIYLVESNADINISDSRLATPLHRAASKGNTDIVKYLLSMNNIIVDTKDIDGNTPLHLACEEDRREEAKLLVDCGAKLDTRNKEQKTPLDLCSWGLRRLLQPTTEGS